MSVRRIHISNVSDGQAVHLVTKKRGEDIEVDARFYRPYPGCEHSRHCSKDKETENDGPSLRDTHLAEKQNQAHDDSSVYCRKDQEREDHITDEIAHDSVPRHSESVTLEASYHVANQASILVSRVHRPNLVSPSQECSTTSPIP